MFFANDDADKVIVIINHFIIPNKLCRKTMLNFNQHIKIRYNEEKRVLE